MYIFIFKDGTIRKTKSYTKEDIINVENNYLDIIDVTNPSKPLICFGEKSWVVVSNV